MASRLTTTRGGEVSQRSYPSSPFRLFEEFFNDWALRSVQPSGREWIPPVDILEKDGNLLLRMEVPGMSEKDIDLKLEGNLLTVHGEKTQEQGEKTSFHQCESRYGAFSRSFSLPDSADREQIQASYKNGILTITVPQRAEVKPRSIKVNS